MPDRYKKASKRFRFGMPAKLTLSIFSIVTILIVSALLSIVEFRAMSTYVSDSISENIKDINLATDFAVSFTKYNSKIFVFVGNSDILTSLDEDLRSYKQTLMEPVEAFAERKMPFADSLKNACEVYLETSFQLDSVIANDFVNTRDWYFTVLQPTYNELRRWQYTFNTGIYDNLHENSIDFDESFYRGVMPGIVSVGAAVLMLLLLLFFIRVYYVRPLQKMLKGMDAYINNGQPYNNVFEGDDQLQELNSDIGNILDENKLLKKRLRSRES